MLQLQSYPFDLPFQYPFTIAKGTKTHQPTLIVSLGLGPQLRGWGEAPAISYYDVTVPKMQETLQAKKAMIERYALTDPMRFWHFLHHLIPGENFLIAALDIAGWDLFAQLRRMPLYRLLGLNYTKTPVTDYTIGIDSIEQMGRKITDHPWPIYKIKISKADDIDMLRALRTYTDAPFRVDANESLSFEEAKYMLDDLKALGVEILEQPLAKTQWEEMKVLKDISPVPLYADESCVEETDVIKCADSFHGINIKLTKCGGITPALRMIEEAKKLGVKVMMGCMNESSIGTAAVAHLSPLLDEIDADGPLLLKEDVGEGLTYEHGRIVVANYPGMGVRLKGN